MSRKTNEHLEMLMRREAARVLGGAKSEVKAMKARENGRRGGRPRKYPRCTKFATGFHQFRKGRCLCGLTTNPDDLQVEVEKRQRTEILERWNS